MMEMEMNAEADRDGASESENSKSAAVSSADTIFCNLERDYAKILNEMKDNEALAQYKIEYTRLFESLYNSHQEEEQLLIKFRQLQEDTIDKSNKIQQFEEKINNQELIINQLNNEIIEKSKLADAAHTREQNSQEIIENLRLTIVKLNHEIEQRNRKISMDENGSIVKQNESSLKEKERLINEIETLKQRIKSMSLYTEELEKKINTVDDEILRIQEQMNMQINEVEKQRAINEEIDKELKDAKNEIEMMNSQLQVANTSVKMSVNNVNKLESTIKDQKNVNEKLRKEVSKLMISGMNLQTELDHAGRQIDQMRVELEEKNNKIIILTIENKRLKEEITKYKAENTYAIGKCTKIDNARANAEKNLKHTEHIVKNIEIEMELCQREIVAEKRIIEAANRDKNIMSKTIDNLKDSIKKSEQLIIISENTKHKIELELMKIVKINNSMNKQLQILLKEKEKFSEQIFNMTQQTEKYANDVKHKDKEILDYKKELSSLKNKLQQQQNFMESVRSEKNMCIKSLAKAQDEIQDLRDKIKLMSGQIEQVKEDAVVKHNTIVKSEFLLKKIEQEKEAANIDLKAAQKEINNLHEIIEKLKKTEKQLRENIKISNIDVTHLKKEINHVMSDRDVLGTQLVRRNDELSLQNSKIKILHGTLSRGERDYTKKLEDIRLLKLEVNKLTTEKMLLIKSMKNMSDLRHETFHLNRDLVQERLKVTTLEEDLQNPLNIHRWRKLQGSEPKTHELLKKIQILQKRIIKMSQELISKSKKINDIEKLYMELREIIMKQPGPEYKSLLSKTKTILHERDQIIKCLIAELNMHECQTNVESDAYEKINAELRNIQVKYNALKRKGQRIIVQENNSTPVLPTVMSNHKKYCGGGFTMLVTPSRSRGSLQSIPK